MTTKIRIEVLGPDCISATVHNKHTSDVHTIVIDAHMPGVPSHAQQTYTPELDDNHSLSICGVPI